MLFAFTFTMLLPLSCELIESLEFSSVFLYVYVFNQYETQYQRAEFTAMYLGIVNI